MVKAADSEKERRNFYSKATHILFAVVLGHGFLLAPEVMIPIQVAFEPENHTAVMSLVFAYVVVVAGWIGYARSVSRHPHKDSGWGVTRFALGIVILFEYFYLIRISQMEEHVWSISLIMVLLFASYLLADMLKIREYGAYYRRRFGRRAYTTFKAVVSALILAIVSLIIGDDMATIIMFVFLVLVFSVAKWRPTTRSQ